MDGSRFDALARSLARARSRRAALGATLGVVGMVVGQRAPDLASAGQCRSVNERKVIKLIHQAADRYNHPRSDMVRVARCESNLDPCAKNPRGPYYGLFQFLRSTWKSTPYRNEDIYDPRANALAAAWMWKKGRRDEWACQ